jgi:hypothetical protein
LSGANSLNASRRFAAAVVTAGEPCGVHGSRLVMSGYEQNMVDVKLMDQNLRASHISRLPCIQFVADSLHDYVSMCCRTFA